MNSAPSPLLWVDLPTGPAVRLLDQTRLPGEEVTVTCHSVDVLVDAIRRLAVRGAPMLGIAGAYGVALAAARRDRGSEHVARAAGALATVRPTAVNLARAVRRTAAAYDEAGGGEPGAKAALDVAQAIEAEDAASCARIAEHGLPFVPEGARILTHCNTGQLVSGGEGTAYAIIAAAHRAGRLAKLWIGETRPLLQGARLTAYEAVRDGLPHAVLPDAAAGVLFARREVDLVAVGADRITADGSVANKVGTYSLAVLARHHGVPFVVAAPTSTIDLDIPNGAGVDVEQRASTEVTAFGGIPTAPAGSPAYNPAFDITPPDLVTAVVTERGVVRSVDEPGLRRVCRFMEPDV
ncbi:MAG: S-methyl-5-thioribose-1-phosphate isomerase [Streptosporangiaceae bacterium]